VPTLDLSKPFTALVMERDVERPDLRLESTLNKVGTTLAGYAECLGKTKDELTLLEICLSNEVLHYALERCPAVLNQEKKYRGQNLSRIRKLVRSLAWGDDVTRGNSQVAIEEQLPDHLRQIWCLFSRVTTRKMSRRVSEKDRKAYYEFRAALPLSDCSVPLILALLRVSKDLGVTDNRRLFEECRENILRDFKSHNPPDRWDSISAALYALRRRIREYLGYQTAKPSRITMRLEDLPEPLRTQVLTFKRRAREGFGEDVKIKVKARKRYKLELDGLPPDSVQSHIDTLLLGLGYIPREAYGGTLDLKDLLKLDERAVEDDGIEDLESYNALVEIYRMREVSRSSVYKEEGYDSVSFVRFIEAIGAVASYNGLLNLRKKFLHEYGANIDIRTREKLKKRKKQVFDLEWLDGQIKLLGVEFHLIADSGSFKYTREGILCLRARRDLNLCIFYVVLVTLRFLGVRQQCVRDCVVGENITFGKKKSLTFEWKTEEVKNGKGVKHSLSMEEHDIVLGTLIDAVWTYYKKIYPYITGGDASLPPEFSATQRQVAAGQFFLECGKNTCHPFKDKNAFAGWFKRMSLRYLDIRGKLGKGGVRLHPHLLRAIYGDWLESLGFSKEQTAAMAGDNVETYKRFYLRHGGVYDATPAWTTKNQEMKARRNMVKAKGKASGVDH